MIPKKRISTIAMRTALLLFCTQYSDTNGASLKRHHSPNTIKQVFTSTYDGLLG